MEIWDILSLQPGTQILTSLRQRSIKATRFLSCVAPQRPVTVCIWTFARQKFVVHVKIMGKFFHQMWGNEPKLLLSGRFSYHTGDWRLVPNLGKSQIIWEGILWPAFTYRCKPMQSMGE